MPAIVTLVSEPLPSMPQATLATPSALVLVPQPAWFARVKLSSTVLVVVAAAVTDPAAARAVDAPGGTPVVELNRMKPVTPSVVEWYRMLAAGTAAGGTKKVSVDARDAPGAI
ncbi:MAG: hypothetical protein E6I33_08835 [Chloroflexi bacterium]|nr:MAG: hypothetical protein E6I33_08835 [Chloroflexota bacterium]